MDLTLFSLKEVVQRQSGYSIEIYLLVTRLQYKAKQLLCYMHNNCFGIKI